jgi:hypothetical protein
MDIVPGDAIISTQINTLLYPGALFSERLGVSEFSNPTGNHLERLAELTAKIAKNAEI